MMTENTFENVNHLVLNFYPDGYSIAVKLNEFPVFTSETILETAKISYEETSLLDYIEHEELPPLLVEMIDSSPKLSQYKIWHNGCLILEVRDKITVNQEEATTTNRNKSNKSTLISSRSTEFRTQNNHHHNHNHHSTTTNNQSDESQATMNNGNTPGTTTDTNKTTVNNSSYFILLKPTNLSILNDVLNLTESNLWSTQERLQLESQIVLQSSPPLFLEPNANDHQIKEHSNNWLGLPSISNMNTRHRKKLPHTKLKSLLATNNRNCIYQATSDFLPPELTLQQFLATKKAKKKNFAEGHLARFHRFKKNLPPTSSIK